MTTRQIVVIGVQEHTTDIIAAAQLAGVAVRAIYDDDSQSWGHLVCGVPVRGPISQAVHAGLPAVLTFDDPCRRQAVAAQLDVDWAVVAHPKAVVDDYAAVGPGARVGAHAIIGARSTVAHDCLVGDFVRLRPGVQLAGYVDIGRCSCLESGAVVIPNVRIGAWSYVGPASVVIRDLADFARATGVPARPVAVPVAVMTEANVGYEPAQPAYRTVG
jgi:acetyltransferase EpsM